MVTELVGDAINLTFNVGQALAIPWAPFQLPRAIFGDVSSYRSRSGFETELAAFQHLDAQTLKRVASVSGLFPLSREPSGPMAAIGAEYTREEERWFFINGICTDRRIAHLNAAFLARMLQREIRVLYNATDGIWFDLIESAFGKGFDAITDSAALNLVPLVEALCDARLERVVLVSHSQGTILAAVMLKWLQEVIDHNGAVQQGSGAQKVSPERKAARKLAGKEHGQPAIAKVAADRARELGLASDHIAKLELYCFANCATSMAPIAVAGTPPHHTPWIESFGNEFDLVARLGVLAPPHGIGSARIQGERYRRDATWGHFLNVHYLAPMLDELAGTQRHVLAPFGENLRKTPRFFDYVDGKTPPPYG